MRVWPALHVEGNHIMIPSIALDFIFVRFAILVVFGSALDFV